MTFPRLRQQRGRHEIGYVAEEPQKQKPTGPAPVAGKPQEELDVPEWVKRPEPAVTPAPQDETMILSKVPEGTTLTVPVPPLSGSFEFPPSQVTGTLPAVAAKKDAGLPRRVAAPVPVSPRPVPTPEEAAANAALLRKVRGGLLAWADNVEPSPDGLDRILERTARPAGSGDEDPPPVAWLRAVVRGEDGTTREINEPLGFTPEYAGIDRSLAEPVAGLYLGTHDGGWYLLDTVSAEFCEDLITAATAVRDRLVAARTAEDPEDEQEDGEAA